VSVPAPITAPLGAGSRRVLIVDDELDIRATLRAAFGSAGYDCRIAGNGREAALMYDTERSPLTITDLKMPVMDGLDLLRHVRARDADAAVIMLTGAADVSVAVESLKQGASDFILKPVDLDQILLSAERALERRQLLIEHREHHVLLEYRVAEATRELASALGELRQTYQATLEALGSALATREVGTELHSRRVHAYSIALARAHGISESELEALGRGVLLHDIGKIGISDAILLKPGPLTPEEWQVMRTHPEVGRQFLDRIPFLRDAIPVVYHHHERWDGTGYPLGLAGSAIPLAARIFAVADAFDALTFDRPYSKAIPMADARERIRIAAGTHFDPDVVATFLAMPLDVFETARARSADRPVA
jgi:response regulator RpfG family c-di-GMP phosphodiesterase